MLHKFNKLGESKIQGVLYKFDKNGNLLTGGATKGTFTIDFGTGDTTTVATVIDSNIKSSSIVLFTPNTNADYYILEEVSIQVTSITDGVSFDVMAYAPNDTNGQYQINYIIQ